MMESNLIMKHTKFVSLTFEKRGNSIGYYTCSLFDLLLQFGLYKTI